MTSLRPATSSYIYILFPSGGLHGHWDLRYQNLVLWVWMNLSAYIYLGSLSIKSCKPVASNWKAMTSQSMKAMETKLDSSIWAYPVPLIQRAILSFFHQIFQRLVQVFPWASIFVRPIQAQKQRKNLPVTNFGWWLRIPQDRRRRTRGFF